MFSWKHKVLKVVKCCHSLKNIYISHLVFVLEFCVDWTLTVALLGSAPPTELSLTSLHSWLAQFINVWTEKHDSQTEQVDEKFTSQVNNPKRKRLKTTNAWTWGLSSSSGWRVGETGLNIYWGTDYGMRNRCTGGNGEQVTADWFNGRWVDAWKVHLRQKVNLI